MNVQIQRERLAEALGNVGLAVPARVRQSALPILGNVLLQTRPDGLLLRGTDLDCTIEQTIPAEVASVGQTTVSHHVLSEFVDALVGDTITLHDDERLSLVIECGRNTARVRTITADDFPATPDIVSDNMLSVAPADLKQSLQLTAFAMTDDEIRPVLHSLLWQIAAAGDSHELTVVGADGYRLSIQSFPVDAAGALAIAVPARAVKAIRQLIGQTEVHAWSDAGRLRIDVGSGIVLTTQLVASTYPDYRSLIPTASTVTLTLPRAELVAAIAASRPFADRGKTAVRLVQQDDKLVVTVETNEVGASQATLPIILIQGPDTEKVRVGLNHAYLAELLGAIPTSAEYVTLGWTGPSKPVVLRVSGLSAFIHVLMPMFVQWP